MAGAGGTGKPQTPDQLEHLREMLIPHIIKHLSGPEPTPPQYQPQALTPFQGYAQARNPQMAGQLEQAYQAPAQAQYAQQQEAFKAAMEGRQQAAQLGATMINAQTRSSMSGVGGRPAMATIIDENGRRISVNVHRGPDGRIAGVEEIGPSPWAPQAIPAVPGVAPPQIYQRGVGEGAVAQNIPGAVTPPAPAAVEEDFRKNAAFIKGSDHLRQAFRELKAQTANRGPLGQAIGQELGEFKYGGAVPYSSPNAKFEAELRTTLDTMIVAVTGLSFPEQAFRRYRSELPVATDSEDQAMTKIDNVVRKFLSEQGSMKQTYPAVGGGAPATSGQYSGMVLHESDFATAKPGERARFIAGGGKVEP
jgi:hypothetical protein